MKNLTLNLNQDTEHKLMKILAMYSDKDAFFRDVISYQIKRMQNEQINIQADLYDFEKKYGISTKNFYSQYKAGKKGDDEDTLIWAGIYEMFLENMQKLSEIQ